VGLECDGTMVNTLFEKDCGLWKCKLRSVSVQGKYQNAAEVN
jgi:hypothetical protein